MKNILRGWALLLIVFSVGMCCAVEEKKPGRIRRFVPGNPDPSRRKYSPQEKLELWDKITIAFQERDESVISELQELAQEEKVRMRRFLIKIKHLFECIKQFLVDDGITSNRKKEQDWNAALHALRFYDSFFYNGFGVSLKKKSIIKKLLFLIQSDNMNASNQAAANWCEIESKYKIDIAGFTDEEEKVIRSFVFDLDGSMKPLFLVALLITQNDAFPVFVHFFKWFPTTAVSIESLYDRSALHVVRNDQVFLFACDLLIDSCNEKIEALSETEETVIITA